tara:strand:+ start:229 stop:624 length:396 start_codon:yes stop_codon:yes gene_type:complete
LSYIKKVLILKSLGTHLLLDLEHCDPEILDDISQVKELLMKAALDCGATVVGETFFKFKPHGVTGVVSIAESHLCVHTWPEYSYASVDIFSCGQSFDVDKSADILIKGFSCSSPRIKRIKRGLEEFQIDKE